MRGFRWVWLPLLLALGSGCSSESVVETAPGRPGRTDGGAVALSRDERIAVVTNRAADVVTVFLLDPARGAANMVTGIREVPTPEGSEPWAAVIGGDDDTAYVILRKSQKVVRLSSLRGEPALDGAEAQVGSEPTDIAISPSGKMLWVSNWADGTINMLTSVDLTVRDTVDLNEMLVNTGALGEIDSRPALAHPYSLAITDNGDDNDMDEKLFVTEFFSQPLPGVLEEPGLDLGHVDRNRQGFVYTHHLTGALGTAIPIAPVTDTGFADGTGRVTSCFPNQLSAATVQNGLLYVTAMCTSPRGPLGPKVADTPTTQNFKTLFHPAVFVVDTVNDVELQPQGRLLTQVLAAYYDAGEHPTNARLPLIPNDIAFHNGAQGQGSAYVSALGASAVFRLDYDAGGTLLGVGSPDARYINTGTFDGLPIGVAVSRNSSPPFALAQNDAMQKLSIIDLEPEAVTVVNTTTDSNEHAKAVRESDANDGRRFFASGLNVWSFNGQAWGSCEACHPGGLSDGVTWYFSRGPRRTLSAANTYEKVNPPEQRQRRLMLWGANIDEVHDIEGIVRSVTGGVGGVLWQYGAQPSSDCRLIYDGSPVPMGGETEPCKKPKPTSSLRNGLNRSLAEIASPSFCEPDAAECDQSVEDWNRIDDFLRSLRAPRAPSVYDQVRAPKGLDPALVEAGRQVFRNANCAGCHSGPHWTMSTLFYTPGADMNGSVPYVNQGVMPALGTLIETTYSPPPAISFLNPPAAGGSATFRRFAPLEQTDEAVIAFAYDTAAAGDDQLQCALRYVGTFPDQTLGENVVGIAPPGAPVPIEVRQDMQKLAQGRNGFNIPSLFGLAVGAPYLHAGNARTLEELFDETFFRHHRALASTFLNDPNRRDDTIKELVQFLLSIDESTAIEDAPTVDGDPLHYDFCR